MMRRIAMTRLRNNHEAHVEINPTDNTFRIVEENIRGHKVCTSPFQDFDCSVEAMRDTASTFGYAKQRMHNGKWYCYKPYVRGAKS
jgi:hypothetical protein